MKKLIVMGAITLAAMAVALGAAPTASAYPETSCNVTVNAQKVHAGSQLRVTGTSQETTSSSPRLAAASVHWRATFNGVTKTANATVFHATFAVPSEKVQTQILLTVRAVQPDATDCQKSLNITVLPSGLSVSPPGDHLPNTGGPRLIFLIAGIVLVLGGAGAVWQSRRRSHGGHSA